MTDLTGSFWGLVGLMGLALLGLKIFALVDAATRRTDLYEAAGKLKKQFWLIILGVAVAWNLLVLNPIGIINIAGVIAAVVYLVDVRPAIRSLGKGGPRGDGQHMGPYGPW